MSHESIDAQEWKQKQFERQYPDLFPKAPEKRGLPSVEELSKLTEVLLLLVSDVRITIQSGEMPSIRVDDWHGSIRECLMSKGSLIIKGNQRPDAPKPSLSVSAPDATIQARNVSFGGISIGNLQAERITQTSNPEVSTLADLRKLLRGEEADEEEKPSPTPSHNTKSNIEIRVGKVDQSSDHVVLTLPPGHTLLLQRGAEKFHLKV
jgi:hypothetical protein